MLVQGMTTDEFVAEVEADAHNVERYIGYKENKIRRAFLKTRKAFTIVFDYTSPRKNKWLIIIIKNRKKGFIPIPVVLEHTERGYGATLAWLPSDKEKTIVSFIPHFFARYKRRLGLKETGMDLIKKFFLDNPHLIHVVKTDLEGNIDYDLFSTTENGVFLGNIVSDERFVYKTFVRKDMLQGFQVELYERSEKARLGSEDTGGFMELP